MLERIRPAFLQGWKMKSKRKPSNNKELERRTDILMMQIQKQNHAIDTLSKQANRTTQFIEGWNDITLSNEDKRAYYRQAMPIRFPEYNSGEERIFDVPKREADKGNSLWKVFNRCQEHILTGGFNVTHSAGKKPRQARELSNIDVVNKINENLWSTTSKFADVYSVN